MSVQNLIVREPDSLESALALLDRNALGLAFVVDDGGRLSGRIASTDIAACLARGGSQALAVRAAMTPEAGGLPADSDEATIARGLDVGGAIVPLLDGERRPVGVATPARARRIPIAEPDLKGNELRYVTECVETGWISSQGSFVRRFEEAIGKAMGSEYVLAVSNGTVALHLALVALGIGPGDEVIVPDLTFAATINAVLHAGATPVLVDVDAVSWNIDIAAAEAAITPRTRAIMPVDLYGQPADWDALEALAKRHDLRIIEDAAEAIGAKHRGRPCGTFGDIGTFSFFSNKVVTTGEGGAIVCRDKAVWEKAKRLRDHGMRPTKRYWHDEVGFNYRLTNLQAAIGVAQLERMDQFVARKLAIAKRYRAGLAGVAGIALPAEIPGCVNSHWMISAIVDPAATGIARDELMTRLGEAGIETRPLFYPLHEMPPYRDAAGNREFPVTTRLSANGLSLPSGVTLTDAEIDFVCSTIERLVAARRLTRTNA